jgi:hypothetical protein
MSYWVLGTITLLQALGIAGDLLPINHDPAMAGLGGKPITIWPLNDASQMHVHSPELAQALPSLLQEGIPVIDLGCGMGYYVSELAKKGYTAYGVEGTPGIQAIGLHTPIYHADLSEPLNLELPDGHVLSFEVAEHLAIEDEATFLDNMLLHARARVVLSWAMPDACAPGRGHGHLNCRSNLYVVRSLFLRGFALHLKDTLWLRGQVRGSAAYWFDGTLLVFDKLDLRTLTLSDLEIHGAASHAPEGARARVRVLGGGGGGGDEGAVGSSDRECSAFAEVLSPANRASFALYDAGGGAESEGAGGGGGVDIDLMVSLAGSRCRCLRVCVGVCARARVCSCACV